MKTAEYDPILAEAGVIEPEFVTDLIGWENEDELRQAGMYEVHEFGLPCPRAWIPTLDTRNPPEPKPITRTRLIWKWFGA